MNSIERDKAILVELGGPTKVAELLSLPKKGGVQRVQNWMTRGIPPAIKVERPDLFLREVIAAGGVAAAQGGEVAHA